MKYLKKFNEDKKQELQDFCNDYLVSLIDDGFEIWVMLVKNYTMIRIDTNNKFNWDDVKDYIIPFIILLNDDQDIKQIIFQFTDNQAIFNKHIVNNRDNNILDIINDTYRTSNEIQCINIWLN